MVRLSEALRWRVSNGVLQGGGTLSPFVSIGLGVLSHENIGLILSQQTGGEDGGNKGRKILYRLKHTALVCREGGTYYIL